MHKYLKLLLLIFIVIIVQSCSEDDSNPLTEKEDTSRGNIAEVMRQGELTTDNIQVLVSALGTPVPFSLTYDVEVYSIDYYTVDSKDNLQLASGALFIPKEADNLPLVSLQHGTETKSTSVASVHYLNSFEGFGGLIFASLGYATVVPDYLGLGVSNINHPYMHAESLTPCIVDFIRAGKKYAGERLISFNNKNFLVGYSEGGYLTLAAQKDIETNYLSEINLTAVAPMAGPYDFRTTVDSILVNGEYSTSVYIAYVLNSYDEVYNWNRLSDFFNSPYDVSVPALFDGTKEYFEISSELPSALSGLLKSEFVNNYLNGGEFNLKNALNENTLLDWTPTIPIHFYHGSADDVVPYQNSVNAVEVFSAKGADVSLTTINGGTHSSSVIESMIGAIEWFNTMK